MIREGSIIKGVVVFKGKEKVVVIVTSKVFSPALAMFDTVKEANNFFEPLLHSKLFDDSVEKVPTVSVREFWRKFYEFRKEDSCLARLNTQPLIRLFT